MEEFSSTLKSSQQSKDMYPFFQVKDQLFQDSYNRHANHPGKILLEFILEIMVIYFFLHCFM